MKVKKYLKANSAQALYGVFRTEVIKKSFVNELFLGVDLAIILNILKYGDFHKVSKKLIKYQKEKLDCVLKSESFSPAKEKGHEKIVKDILEKKNPEKLSEVKSELPDTISYFDIKATLASLSAKPHRIGIDEVKRTQAKKRSFKSYG